MQYLSEYSLFLGKAVTIVVAILVVIGGLVSLLMKHKKTKDKHMEVTLLNEEYEEMEKSLSNATLGPECLKKKEKAERKTAKQQAKIEKKGRKKNIVEGQQQAPKKRIFVLSFKGDMKASGVETLREEISAVLTAASENDEVLVRLESSGGTVHGYGLGASQLKRIRDCKIPLTVSVDSIAASGGYMMACVANKIIAAPFAIIGSIGVLAQVPNLHRLLKKHEIDFEQLHAGEYKRTLTLFGENTEKGRKKMQQELEETHQLFKDFVKSQRPSLDIDAVATGEYWLGTRALALKLVDRLCTSDDYLMSNRNDAQLIQLSISGKKSFMDKIFEQMSFKWRKQGKLAGDLQRPVLM